MNQLPSPRDESGNGKGTILVKRERFEFSTDKGQLTNAKRLKKDSTVGQQQQQQQQQQQHFEQYSQHQHQQHHLEQQRQRKFMLYRQLQQQHEIEQERDRHEIEQERDRHDRQQQQIEQQDQGLGIGLPNQVAAILHGVMGEFGIQDSRVAVAMESVARKVYQHKALDRSSTIHDSFSNDTDAQSSNRGNMFTSFMASPLIGASGASSKSGLRNIKPLTLDAGTCKPGSARAVAQLRGSEAKVLSAYNSSGSYASHSESDTSSSMTKANVQSKALISRKGSSSGSQSSSSSSNSSSSSGLRRKQIFTNAKMLLERNGSRIPEILNEEKQESPRNSGVRWSKEQDEALIAATKQFDERNWKGIAQLVPDRDHVQCLQRWKKVLKPGLIKGPWTKEEDDKLIQLVTDPKFSKQWSLVADSIPGRTPKQCRERWGLNLDPAINRSEWTAVEDAMLLSLHSTMGPKWCEIKCQFTGRTENAVKTRFKSLMRAQAREWSADQDKRLILAMHEHGQNWQAIADCFPKRTKNAIKGRVRELKKMSKS